MDMGFSVGSRVRLLLNICFGLSSIVAVIQSEVTTTTACYGVIGCNTFTLECSTGYVIKVTSLQYGYKGYACSDKENRCFRGDRNGCCVYDPDDCFENFSALHAFNVLKECSAKQNCGPLQAPFNILTSCNNKISSYVLVEYECVQINNALDFCETSTLLSASTVNIRFDPTRHVFSHPTNCSCFVSSTSRDYAVGYNDVRLSKTQSNGIKCSSATLDSLPQDDVGSLSCDVSNPEGSTEYGLVIFPDVTIIRYTLANLYQTGKADEPDHVWLSIHSMLGHNVTVVCFQDDPSVTAIPTLQPTTSPSSQHPNTTQASEETDSSYTGAIAAGVIIPILVLVAVGVIFFIFWKRRRAQLQKHEAAQMNPYVEAVESDVYDVIPANYTANIANTSENKTYNSDTGQVGSKYSPTYQNVHTVITRNGQFHPPSQERKIRFQKVKDQTDRIIAFFRKSPSNVDLQAPEARGRENSGASYDHINAMAAVSARPESEKGKLPGHGHVYSHTKDVDEADQMTKEPSAVSLGDSYIEFKFDVADGDVVLQQKEQDAKEMRLKKPNRPPPFPISSAKPSLNPSRLSPILRTSQNDSLTNDYATKSPWGSMSDVSQHSYKVLEKNGETNKPLVYDYADISNHEAEGNSSVPVMYEMVNYEMQEKPIKRQKTLSDEDGYLAPFATLTQAQLNPEINKSGSEASDQILTSGVSSNASSAKSQSTGDISSSENKAVKKGVLGRAQMFESKA